MSVLMTYGTYTLDPAPILTLSMRHVRNEAGDLIDIIHTASLQGKLLSIGTANPGPATLLDLQNQMRSVFSTCGDCKLFHFSCDGTVLIGAYAKVNSITFSPSSDNWVFTSNYEIELQWNALSDVMLISGMDAASVDRTCFTCLSSTDESWEVSIPDNPARYYLTSCSGRNRDVVQVSHTVSARGYNCCISGVLQNGWQLAKDWVIDRLGYTSGILLDVSGAFSFNPTDFTTYNHSRTTSINKGVGDFSVNEQWTLLGSTGIPACLEDFSVTVDTDATSRFTNVNIQGTITGLESRNSSFVITKTRYESAEECWAEVEPLIYSRVDCVANTTCPLRTTPSRSSIVKSPTAGTIGYAYTFDSRPQLVTGSLSEQINISDTLASEQVAVIPVLGRRAGPILYPLQSNNPLQKTANISILMSQPTGCYQGADARTQFCNLYNTPNTSGIENLLCCLESGMTQAGYTFYRTNDTQEYSPIEGQLSRSTTWQYFSTNCSGTAPGSFC